MTPAILPMLEEMPLHTEVVVEVGRDMGVQVS